MASEGYPGKYERGHPIRGLDEAAKLPDVKVFHAGTATSGSQVVSNGGRVLERIANGESLIVTLDGRPIAELRPLPSRALSAATLLARWRRLPAVDGAELRADVDRTLDASISVLCDPLGPPR